MSREEIIEAITADMRTILFEGYFCAESDPAMRYRKMCSADARLSLKVQDIVHRLTTGRDGNGVAKNGTMAIAGRVNGTAKA